MEAGINRQRAAGSAMSNHLLYRHRTITDKMFEQAPLVPSLLLISHLSIAWPKNATDETNSPNETRSDLSLAMLLAFYTMFFFLLACYTCVVFCMHLFLHLSVSAFLLLRISVFLHFYMSTTLSIASVMHFCISAFLHCSSASILDLFSHVKMRVFLHFYEFL